MVIPVFNEAESIGVLIVELLEVLQRHYAPETFEVVIVDDGSTDSTLSVIEDLSKRIPQIRIVGFKRNLGQTPALALGLKESQGEVVVAMDGDGQNDPEDIPDMVNQLLGASSDCVSGWRKDRAGDQGPRVILSSIANRLIMTSTGVRIHDTGCTLKAYRGDVARALNLRGEMHRLIPFQIHLQGGLIEERVVRHRPRIAGHSKYTLNRTFRVLQDIIAAFYLKRFMHRPMHFLGTVSSLIALFGGFILVLALAFKLFGYKDFVETPLLIVGLVAVLSALQILGVGLLMELLVRLAASSNIEAHQFARRERK